MSEIEVEKEVPEPSAEERDWADLYLSQIKLEEEEAAAPVAPGEVRDWAELHRDALMVIFRKVGMHEVLLRTSKVCSPWRKAARDDPFFWRKIDMGMDYKDDCPIFNELSRIEATVPYYRALKNVTKAAVNLGGNSVEELRIIECWDGNLLEYIAERAKNLKSLSLVDGDRFCEAMAKALGRLKQLEELEIISCGVPAGLMKTIGKECPQLKCLKLGFIDFFGRSIEEGIRTWLGIPKTMLQLEYLQLIRTCTTNEELMKILEKCPNLEMLDLRGSTKITVKYDDVQVRCSRIHTMLLPHEDIYDDIYDYTDDDIDDDNYDYNTDQDSYDDSYVDNYNYFHDYDY